MSQIVQHPRVRWVHLTRHPDGSVTLRCAACGAAAGARNTGDVEWFASQHAEHQSSPTHYGAGDVISGMTKAVGIEPCTPCEARRRRLNGLLPRIFRRRR